MDVKSLTVDQKIGIGKDCTNNRRYSKRLLRKNVKGFGKKNHFEPERCYSHDGSEMASNTVC